jgi:hypothetical protein
MKNLYPLDIDEVDNPRLFCAPCYTRYNLKEFNIVAKTEGDINDWPYLCKDHKTLIDQHRDNHEAGKGNIIFAGLLAIVLLVFLILLLTVALGIKARPTPTPTPATLPDIYYTTACLHAGYDNQAEEDGQHYCLKEDNIIMILVQPDGYYQTELNQIGCIPGELCEGLSP